MSFSAKVLAVLLVATVAVCSGQNEIDSVQPGSATELQEKLGKILALKFIDYYFKNAELNTDAANLFPIIPPFEEDVAALADMALTIPEDSILSGLIYGNVSFCQVQASGLTTIWNDLGGQVDEPGPSGSINFTLTIGDLNFDGLDDILVHVLEGVDKITANGNFHFGINGLYFNAILNLANIDIFSKIDITGASLDMTLGGLEIYFENATENDIPVPEGDWPEISQNVTTAVTLLWKNTLDPILEWLLPGPIGNLISECRLVDFVFRNFTCIGAPAGTDGIQKLILDEMADLVQVSDLASCPAQPETTSKAEKVQNSTNNNATGAKKGDGPRMSKPASHRSDSKKSGANFPVPPMAPIASIPFFLLAFNGVE